MAAQSVALPPDGLLQNFLQTLSPEQYSSFNLLAQAHIAAAPVAATPLQALNARRPGAVARRANATMSKRPVNSFMAFRRYYSGIFTGATQICKSGLVSTIWAGEAKRALWALMGEAYSDMRDHHEEAIPLDAFLALAVPLLPLIPADLYLSKMGWQLIQGSGGETLLTRHDFDASALEAEYPSRTSISAADIVNHCYQHGLAHRAQRQRKPSLREIRERNPPRCGALTLAVAPQVHAIDAASPASSPSISDDYLTIGAVTADQQDAFARHAEALHFHPNISPILGFDPRIIQDDFDPFDLDLSHLIDFDA